MSGLAPKRDIENIATLVLPKVADMERLMLECERYLKSLREFVQKTDEEMLFRATRMDFELVSREL